MGQYDTKCRQCEGGVIRHGDSEEVCANCSGWGCLLTVEGWKLLQFLQRRGYPTPMSPAAEEELGNMIE